MTFFSWLGSFVNLGANLTDTEKIFNRLNDDEKRRLSDEFIYSVGMGVSRFFQGRSFLHEDVHFGFSDENDC